MIVFLDTGVLGYICNPGVSPEVVKCQRWFAQLLARGAYFVTSEVCDYEIRRGLLLTSNSTGKSEGIEILNSLKELIIFLPVTQQVWVEAAKIWAEARKTGKPTSNEKNIDVDMIIAAHWQILKQDFPGRYVVISTTNLKHLNRFAEAQEWQNISY